MTTDHPLLSDIRAGVLAKGSHTHRWGELRREVFPGLASWLSLKAWCAENDLECDLTFGQSSKTAEVQFRRADKARALVTPAVV